LSHDLYEKSKLVGTLSGLGSTAVVLVVRHGVAHLAYAGDSRAYLLRGHKLVQLTADQTTAAALVRAGHLSPEVAERSPLRHSLEEYIGKRSKLEPGVRSRKMQRRDRWLLCSDGVTKGLSDGVICDALLQSPDVETACREIVRAANEADGSDNITAVVIESCPSGKRA
jgi:protein phosphatase